MASCSCDEINTSDEDFCRAADDCAGEASERYSGAPDQPPQRSGWTHWPRPQLGVDNFS